MRVTMNNQTIDRPLDTAGRTALAADISRYIGARYTTKAKRQAKDFARG